MEEGKNQGVLIEYELYACLMLLCRLKGDDMKVVVGGYVREYCEKELVNRAGLTISEFIDANKDLLNHIQKKRNRVTASKKSP